MVAFCLGTGQGVGTINVINLDDDLQPDATRPDESIATEVVVCGQLCVILDANGYNAPLQWHISIRGPSLWWREPEGRLIEAD